MKITSRICKRSFALPALSFSLAAAIAGQQTGPLPLVIETPEKQVKAHVVAIRRVNLLLGDIGQRITDEIRKPYVEIELYVGKPNFNTQLQYLVQIGDRQFLATRWNRSDDKYNAVLLIPTQEFEELTDGADIYCRVGVMMPREEFKKLYDEGKLAGNHGLYVGKLDKTMIDLEPTVEKRAGWKPPQ